MNKERLIDIMSRFPDLRILVMGDFFLDQYLTIEQALAERSLETGLEAHQVVHVACSPGAAGNVAANVSALDASVMALGVIGDDGHGFELERALAALGIDTQGLICARDRITPTYTKPILRGPDGSLRELNRLDAKNRSPLPSAIEEEVIARLRALVPAVHAVIIADQVQETNCGVITDRLRDELSAVARAHPEVIFAADSRQRIGLFRDVILKPNEREAVQAIRPSKRGRVRKSVLVACAEELWRRSGKPLFLTRGEKGIMVFAEACVSTIPAWTVSDPIDVVGAGDTALAALAVALAAGASASEAADVAVRASAITIKQIAVTGVATRAQIAALQRQRRMRGASSPGTEL